MLADVPQMTWLANIKMRLWRFVDKMDRTHALIPQSSGLRQPLKKQPSAGSGAEARRDRMSGPGTTPT
jgi:hypothetical protein